jgi:hypothetical protein
VAPLADDRRAERLLEKAEECKNADGRAYEVMLAELFGRPTVQTRHAYNLIMTLPFKAYITTNFDPLLAAAGMTHGHTNLYAYPSLPAREIERSSKTIFYLHGLARRNNEARGDNLVLARSDFEVAYEGSVRIFLENLLLSYPILFLGCSLAEPAVHEAMRRVHKVHDQIRREYKEMEPPRRYVLLPVRKRIADDVSFAAKSERDLDAETAEDDRFSELAVRVLRYNVNNPHQHYEVEEVLEKLCTLNDTPVRLEPKVGYGEEMPS